MTTQTGLTVKAALLNGHYHTQGKVSNAQMAEFNPTHRKICPQWNYIIHQRETES
jgi:hypothetical protein